LSALPRILPCPQIVAIAPGDSKGSGVRGGVTDTEGVTVGVTISQVVYPSFVVSQSTFIIVVTGVGVLIGGVGFLIGVTDTEGVTVATFGQNMNPKLFLAHPAGIVGVAVNVAAAVAVIVGAVSIEVTVGVSKASITTLGIFPVLKSARNWTQLSIAPPPPCPGAVR